MPTPSLYPILMKAVASGIIRADGTEYIETFGLEMMEMIEVELVELDIDIEVVDLQLDVEVIEIIDVEIIC